MEKKERELDVGTSRENPPWMTWPQSFGPTVTFRVIGSTRGPSFSIDSDWRTSSPREASRPGSDIEYNCRDSLENSSTLFSFLFIEREIDCQKLAGRSWLLCTQSVSRVTSKKKTISIGRGLTLDITSDRRIFLFLSFLRSRRTTKAKERDGKKNRRGKRKVAPWVHSLLDDSWTQRDLILKITSEKTVTNGGSFSIAPRLLRFLLPFMISFTPAVFSPHRATEERGSSNCSLMTMRRRLVP